MMSRLKCKYYFLLLNVAFDIQVNDQKSDSTDTQPHTDGLTPMTRHGKLLRCWVQ